MGVFVEGGFLKITDRKKEIFKNNAGKYISPSSIENKLKECSFIEQCIVIGDGQKFASALIIPSLSHFNDYFEKKNLPQVHNQQLADHDEVRSIIMEHVKKINATLAPYEQVKRPQLICANWTVESGEITPKLSLRRKVIVANNKAVIEKIFGLED